MLTITCNKTCLQTNGADKDKDVTLSRERERESCQSSEAVNNQTERGSPWHILRAKHNLCLSCWWWWRPLSALSLLLVHCAHAGLLLDNICRSRARSRARSSCLDNSWSRSTGSSTGYGNYRMGEALTKEKRQSEFRIFLKSQKIFQVC